MKGLTDRSKLTNEVAHERAELVRRMGENINDEPRLDEAKGKWASPDKRGTEKRGVSSDRVREDLRTTG